MMKGRHAHKLKRCTHGKVQERDVQTEKKKREVVAVPLAVGKMHDKKKTANHLQIITEANLGCVNVLIQQQR